MRIRGNETSLIWNKAQFMIARECIAFPFVSLHTSQLSSRCLTERQKRNSSCAHLAASSFGCTAQQGDRGTWKHCRWAATLLCSPQKVSSPSHLTSGAKTPGSSRDPATCCALHLWGLPTGDGVPVPSRGPFQPPHPFMQKASGWGPPAQEREYFFHLMARLSSPARVVSCAAAHPGCIFAVRGCRTWLRLLNLGDKRSDRQRDLCAMHYIRTAEVSSCFSGPCVVFSMLLGQDAPSSAVFALLLPSFFVFL